MVYIIGIVGNFDDTLSYVLFETHTESYFRCNEKFLVKLIEEQKIEMRNASLLEGSIKIKNWGNQLHYDGVRDKEGATYMALCKIHENKFKLVSYTETIVHVTLKGLQDYIEDHKIHNSTLVNGKFEILNTYNINYDEKFEKDIAEKYKKHVALTALLGRKTAFDYYIEGTEIKLIKYISQNKNVIIPNFVNSILAGAFLGCDVESVTIGTGVRYIGANAFDKCNISEVVIPENVEFIGPGAFNRNKRLVTDGGYHKETIKVLGESTVIIQRYNNAK